MAVSMFCPKSRGYFLISDVRSEVGAGVWASVRELGYFLALGKLVRCPESPVCSFIKVESCEDNEITHGKHQVYKISVTVNILPLSLPQSCWLVERIHQNRLGESNV